MMIRRHDLIMKFELVRRVGRRLRLELELMLVLVLRLGMGLRLRLRLWCRGL